MNMDRYALLKRTFAFSGGDPGRCYSLPVNPRESATEPACCCAPAYPDVPGERREERSSRQAPGRPDEREAALVR